MTAMAERTDHQADFLATAETAVQLLRHPAVAAAWAQPSALPKLDVAGLAGHLAYQILVLPQILAAPLPTEPTVPLLGHYERALWVDADLDADINVRIRDGGTKLGAQGAANLADQVEEALRELALLLPAAQNRPVRIPWWGAWSLTTEDFLTTRVMELAVHGDDLAVSVGVDTPSLPPGAAATVVDLLARLAVRRHGPTNVIRALSRAERAPETIAAF